MNRNRKGNRQITANRKEEESMNRLMILGSMDEFVSLVKKARERGYYTIVCDGYTDGPAKRYADRSYDVDIRQADRVAQICREESVNGIIGSFSDILFEYLVKIADRAGLKTYCTPEQSIWLRSKKHMRQMFAELNVPCPKNRVLDENFTAEQISNLTFPVVMKPVNGYGSRGVFVAGSTEEICARFEETARYSIDSRQIMVEEYNDGLEFNMMNWIMDGEVYTLSIADREKSTEIKGDIPHITRLVYPSRFMDAVYEEAREIVRKVAAYVGIVTGPLCMQFFYRPGQGIQVCECAGRFFGYEHELLTYSSGFSIEDLLLDYVYDEAAMRERVAAHSAELSHIVCGMYFHGHEGVVGDLRMAEQAICQRKPLEYKLFYHTGEQISHEVGAKPYVIQVDLTAKSYDGLDQTCRSLISELQVPDYKGNNLLYHSEIPAYVKA